MKSAPPKVLIIHGWASSPRRGWIKWLASELRAKGYVVEAPALPKPRQPDPVAWVETIHAAAGDSKRLIVIGHSLGTYALLEFIKGLPPDVRVEQAIFVAGFYLDKTSTYWPEHYLTDKDFIQLRRRIKKSLVIYSNDDRVVVPNRSRALAQRLKAELLLDPGQRHFSNLKLKTLPIVLQLLENTRQNT